MMLYYELLKFKKEILCEKCQMRLVDRGTVLAILDNDEKPVVAQSSGGYPMDELQGTYYIQCDCGERVRFETTADAAPLYGDLDNLLPIKVFCIK